MFRSIIFYFCVFLFVSCGVGSYSVSSGVPDRSMISFCASSKYSITVYIDGEMHQTQTVKQKPYKSGRNIKQTSKTAICLPSGVHDVRVLVDGAEVFAQKVFLSTSEHKVIEL